MEHLIIGEALLLDVQVVDFLMIDDSNLLRNIPYQLLNLALYVALKNIHFVLHTFYFLGQLLSFSRQFIFLLLKKVKLFIKNIDCVDTNIPARDNMGSIFGVY